MKRSLFPLLILLILFSIGWSFLAFGTNQGYKEYLSGWEYRRLHPELIPSPIAVKAFDMGHTNSYASLEWLKLIQYVGDNVGGNRFLQFTHAILENITILHPYFTKPYELDLILTPLSVGENLDPDQRDFNKKYTEDAIALGKKGMSILCDTEKINSIISTDISESLWNNTALRNPCVNAMIPYYIAFATYQMGNNKAEASKYYKIAAMHDDGPTASRILSVIALAADGDFRASAMTFFLIGSSGYDLDPFTCNKYAGTLARDLIENKKVDATWIAQLQQEEKNILKDTRDDSIPASKLSDNCYDMTTRGIREVYLDYIREITRGTPAKNKEDIIALGILREIPTLSTQSGYTVREINGIWSYRAN